MVRVGRLELPASWSQTMRSTNWATPGCVLVKSMGRKRLLLRCRHRCHPTPGGFTLYFVHPLIFLNMTGLEPARRRSASLPSTRFLRSRMPCALDVFVYHFRTCSGFGVGFWLNPASDDLWKIRPSCIYSSFNAAVRSTRYRHDVSESAMRRLHAVGWSLGSTFPPATVLAPQAIRRLLSDGPLSF